MRAFCLALSMSVLAACVRPAPEPAAADVAPAVAATRPPAPSMQRHRSPALTFVVLDDEHSDSPFHWEPVEAGPPRTRVMEGELWAPAIPVVAVMRPGEFVEFAGGELRVAGTALDVAVRPFDGEAWSPVAPLARALGGYAHPHPDDGSVALWPAPMLQWLAANGDPRAPVLIGARAAGALPAAGAPVASATSRLRIRNTGPDDLRALTVLFPDVRVDFGDVAAGATSDWRDVPGGVYAYGAYEARIDGVRRDVPVIDWVGEAPMPAASYTYVVGVDGGAPLPITLQRVEPAAGAVR
jgi:hypothetical protein